MGKEGRSERGQRIVVVGTTGAGKTTVARAIAERLGIAHIELDALFWGPDWGKTPDVEFIPRVNEATRGDRWVLDGNYSRTRAITWQRADTIVWLDYSFPRVFWQLLRRTVERAAAREELWEGCRESIRISFLSRDSIFLWCLRTYWRRRREYPRVLALPEHSHLRVVRLRTPRETATWLRLLGR